MGITLTTKGAGQRWPTYNPFMFLRHFSNPDDWNALRSLFLAGVLRVSATPTWDPTNIHYTPLDNTHLCSTSFTCASIIFNRSYLEVTRYSTEKRRSVLSLFKTIAIPVLSPQTIKVSPSNSKQYIIEVSPAYSNCLSK